MWMPYVLRAAILATAGGVTIRGDVLYGLFCVCAVGLTLVPSAFGRTTNRRAAYALEVMVLLLMVSDMTLGNLLGLYGKLPWYDKLLHLGASLVIGWIGFLSMYVFPAGRSRARPYLAGVTILLVTLGVGALWEIAEYGVDRLLGRATQSAPGMSPHDDTMIDLAIDAIGGTIAGVIAGVSLASRARGAE